ncbi:MAG: MMPL family transporter [Pirellulales bacterium]|nr:MMPL family transporter [Pirellulales bacterium]
MRASSWIWIIVWVGLAIMLRLAAPPWDEVVHDDNLSYLPQEMTSPRAQALLARAFPEQNARSQLVLVVAREGDPLDPSSSSATLTASDFEFAAQVAEAWQENAAELRLSHVWTHHTEVVGNQLKAADEEGNLRAILVMAQVRQDFMEVDNLRLVELARQFVAQAGQDVAQQSDFMPGVAWGLTGSTVLGADLLSAARESLQATEWITIALVLGFLLLVYRAPLLALVPLAAIGVAWWCGIHLLTWSTQWHNLWSHLGLRWELFTTVRIFITVLVFGSGTDYCLFLIARYKEELHYGVASSPPGLRHAAALDSAVAGVHSALLGSALTTVVGVGILAFADFGKFQIAGVAIAGCLLITYLVSITLAPALLLICGNGLFWNAGWGSAPPSERNKFLQGNHLIAPPALSLAGLTASDRFWRSFSDRVLAYPGLGWLGTLALFALPVWWGWQVPVRYDQMRDLGSERPGVQGFELLSRHFPAGMTGPVTLIVESSKKSLAGEEGKEWIRELSHKLRNLPSVAVVRSLTQPLGATPRVADLLRPGRASLLLAEKTQAARDYYLSATGPLAGQATRFELQLIEDPFSPGAVAALQEIEAVLAEIQSSPAAWPELTYHLGGITAATRDLAAVTNSDQNRIMILAWLGVLGVTLVLLRQPLLCFYLMVTVLVSYFATLGITAQVFTWWWGAGTSGIDWKVPLFLYVILIAVGQDYNIYLVTRVLEEQERHPPALALRRGLARTGGIITSCGLIMAASFVAMIAGELRSIVELGFALTLGVLLDTLVVRTILVPSGWELYLRARANAPPVAVESLDFSPVDPVPVK